MHRCGQVGNILGPCTCTTTDYQTNSTFSMFFSMPNKPTNYSYDHQQQQDHMYFSSSSPSPAHVDCTLSLGTPSTRLSSNDHKHHQSRTTRPSCISNFCFDILHSKNNTPSPSPSPSPSPLPYKTTTGRTNSGAGNTNNNNNISAGGDALVARRCANCDTTSTPLWRNGPRGPKSLCNACGIRFKKEERRASAAASTTTTTTTTNSNSSNASSMMDVNPWAVHQQQYSQSQKMHYISPAGNVDQFRFTEDHESAADNAIPFLSWRLNVTDRPSLIHDFTR